MDISLGIFDYLAVIIFAVSAGLLTHTIWHKIDIKFKICAVFGSFTAFVAGVIKATHKLILLAKGNDITTMRNVFFVINGCGFLFIAVAMLAFLLNFIYNKVSNKVQIPVLVISLILLVLGPILFVFAPLSVVKPIYMLILSISYIFIISVFIVISVKTNKKLLIISYVLSIVFLFVTVIISMPKDLNEWIKESFNTINQVSFLISVILFRVYYFKYLNNKEQTVKANINK